LSPFGEIGLESELAELSRQTAIPASAVATVDSEEGDDTEAADDGGFDPMALLTPIVAPIVEALVGAVEAVEDFLSPDADDDLVDDSDDA